MNYKIEVQSLEQTLDLAKKMGKYLSSGMVLTLDGDLGAGKTTFTKGLAEGLEIKRNVNSPTFTIIKEYEGRLPLYHMDVYRLEHNIDMMGFDEYFENKGVCVIEWASKIKEMLPKERMEIWIQRKGDTQRMIEITIVGEAYECMNEVLKNVCTSN